jgi:hypothetical protein
MARLDTGVIKASTSGRALKIARVEYAGDASGTLDGTYTAGELGFTKIVSAFVQSPIYYGCSVTYTEDGSNMIVACHTTNVTVTAATPPAATTAHITVFGY